MVRGGEEERMRGERDKTERGGRGERGCLSITTAIIIREEIMH